MYQDDTSPLAPRLATTLSQYGHDVTSTSTPAQVTQHLRTSTAQSVDVAVIGFSTASEDCERICRDVRTTLRVPIFIVGGAVDLETLVRGLRLGVDDYLAQPYAVVELLARLYALRRRRQLLAGATLDGPVVIAGSDIVLDRRSKTATRAGKSIGLTRKEFETLAVLAEDPGTVVPRAQILSQVWGRSHAADEHNLDVHIASIRHKAGKPGFISTVRRLGYRLGDAVRHE